MILTPSKNHCYEAGSFMATNAATGSLGSTLFTVSCVEPPFSDQLYCVCHKVQAAQNTESSFIASLQRILVKKLKRTAPHDSYSY